MCEWVGKAGGPCGTAWVEARHAGTSRVHSMLIAPSGLHSILRRGWLGVVTQVMHKTGSHTPLGNFSSKRGNKNFYKGRGGNKYGIPGPKGGFVRRGYPKWDAPDLADFPVRAREPLCVRACRRWACRFLHVAHT